MNISIETLTVPASDADVADLRVLLRDAVEGGASVGFMLPLSDAEIARFWAEIFPAVANGERVLLVARDAGRIAGSVQLELAQRPNSRHRCELQKLLVLRSHRGRGVGTALLSAAETSVRSQGRSLIVLDTGASGNALSLYARGRYTRAGVIPHYARDPDGPLIDTVIYYKHLPEPRGSTRP